MRARLTLRSTQFRHEREQAWKELEELLGSLERRGAQRLTAAELGRLPMLYRGVLSALSVARAISLDRNLIAYLEGLAARAYVAVYASRAPMLRVMGRFFARDFPATLWRTRGALLLATLFLSLGLGAGFLATARDPERFHAFVDPDLAQGRGPGASTEELRRTLYDDEDERADTTLEHLVVFSSMLFTHNSKVGMLCFALGCVPVVPDFYLLFQNGAMLGAFGALFHERGLGVDFWGWVMPHGVTEILAILVCGAAGLRVGLALLFPGELTRMAALRRRGREAGTLVLGAIAMFFVAGLIEGIFRQRVTDLGVRYGVVALSCVFWALYVGWWGRRLERP